MKVLLLPLLVLTLLMSSTSTLAQSVSIQGHRGARGLMPENTIPAFLKALEYGVDVLELDVVSTADGKVIVSHEAFFRADITTADDESEITAENERSFNIYKMSLEEVQKFDVGIKPFVRFPKQEKIAVNKPTLQEVVSAVNAYLDQHPKVKRPAYNIEVKTEYKGDGIFQPSVSILVDLMQAEFVRLFPERNYNVQSFDFRVLKRFHEKFPEVPLAMLVENHGQLKRHLKQLGFTPEIYSPDYQFLSQSKVKQAHKLGMKVIPWTVNDPTIMRLMIDFGVDGIITDYPDRAAKL